jgi:hypothetical protein
MDTKRVRVGSTVVDLACVASAHWGGKTLYVYLQGGRFLQFKGDEAQRMWLKLAADVPELPAATVEDYQRSPALNV